MPRRISYRTIDISSYAAGGTISLPVSNLMGMYVVTGSPDITGSLSITSSGTPALGMGFEVLVKTGATLDGGSISLFSTSIGVQAYDRLYRVVYNGTNWKLFELTHI